MNLPPLPLIDGCLFVDNSFLDLLSCPRKLQYAQLEKKVSAADAPALSFGTAIHLALEVRYRKHEPIEDLNALENDQVEVLAKHFEENPPPEGDHRDLNFAIEVVKQYNQIRSFEPFNLLTNGKGEKMVEMSFALPLFTYEGTHHHGNGSNNYTIPIIYTGRIDLPVSWDDQIILIDHKTTGMLGTYFFDNYRMSAQLIGYCWAFQQCTGMKVGGFAINAVRTKAKTVKMLSGVETKANESKWWSETFFREREYIDQWRIDEWKTNVIARVEEFLWHYSRDFMPMKTNQCTQFGRCQYYDVCYYPPQNRGVILESNQFKENTWSPLQKPKTKETTCST